MMIKNKNNLFVLTPLFLVLIVDTMGVGLIFPILSPLFLNPDTGILPTASSILLREVMYGFTLGIFSVATFFGAPFLGDLSDRIGRKKALLLCLLGTSLGLTLSAIGINTNNLFLLITGRVIAGFLAGSQAIAQAAIADISDHDNKANNISFIVLANSVGFIIGPIFGGYFADSSVVSWFNYATPFYAAAILALINSIGLVFTLRETFIPTIKRPIQILKGLMIFADAFRYKNIRGLSIALFLTEMGWAIYFLYISLFLVQVFHYNNLQIGHFMAFYGIVWGISLGLLIRAATKFLSLNNIVLISVALSIIGMIINVFINEAITWWAVIPLGIGSGILYSALIAIFSNAVDQDSQGWIMGIAGAIVSSAWAFSGLIIGICSTNIYVPFILATVITALGGLVFYWQK